MTRDCFAHTLPGSAKERWQSLREHLEAVARTAGEFAAVFGAREWGEAAGRWHDLGKYSEAFQDYLKNAASPAAAGGAALHKLWAAGAELGVPLPGAPGQMNVLRSKQLEVCDKQHDSLRFYFLGSLWKRRVERHRAKEVVDLDDPLIT